MKRALVVVDCLNDFLSLKGALNCGEAGRRVIPRIAEEIEAARRDGVEVIYACDRHLPDDREFELYPPHCIAGTWGAEVVEELRPAPGDRVMPKRRFSAFFGTDLELALREHGVEEIRLVGVCTNICVLYTAADARMRGLEVVVPADAVASFDEAAHENALRELTSVLKARVEGSY
ncbi:MAG: cysteine hydrolase [Thermaerobacter sp.]|nr:cysteine hydrolase [Thermaerobacter sp.]